MAQEFSVLRYPTSSARFLILFFYALCFGCASTDFSKSPNPATITETRNNLTSGLTHWGENKIFRIANMEFGYYGIPNARMLGGSKGFSYKVDSGATNIYAWYYDNASDRIYLSNQTEVVKIPVSLKPNGNYELRSKQESGKIQFSIFDLDANASVGDSDWVEVIIKPLPAPTQSSQSSTFIPIFIPKK